MDHAGLLQALPFPDKPCGDDLSFSAAFDQIQAARRADDPTLAQGEWVTDIKEADWRGVIRLCETLLGAHSKDLRMAGWLTEALGQAHGLAGLADGHTLTAALCEAFWDDIHPQPEDGDFEPRIGALDWLLAQTTRLLRALPLSASPRGRYSLADLETARANARNPAAADEGSAPRLSLEAIDTALRDTPPQHFSDGLRDAARLNAALDTLQALLEARLGEAAPAFGPARDALDDLTRNLRRHAPSNDTAALPEAVADQAATSAGPVLACAAAPAGEAFAAVPAGGPPQSRAEALRQLEGIAAFFRRTEPHSPVAYLAEKAVRWANMPLHEWLRSVVKDDSALLRVEELLGVEERAGGE